MVRIPEPEVILESIGKDPEVTLRAVASQVNGERLTFVTLDRKLGQIAEREGFEVVG